MLLGHKEAFVFRARHRGAWGSDPGPVEKHGLPIMDVIAGDQCVGQTGTQGLIAEKLVQHRFQPFVVIPFICQPAQGGGPFPQGPGKDLLSR